ncbi:hypothetical protein [Euzebya tangerina]|uniref:hypothetical protein n=1 Tax=Euzebya tangerina TaxID=591198 RepID=UPI0013C2F379|nr:hypothetical protein [Euzebya tangerina]
MRHAMILAAVLLFLLTGCDDSGNEILDEDAAIAGAETQPELGLPEAGEEMPAAGPDTVVDGELAEIPLPTASQPLSPASQEDGVTVQTFSLRASSVEDAIAHFEEVLPPLGWSQIDADASGDDNDDGEQQLQSRWAMGDQELLISAAPLEQDDSQFSLQLSG